MIYKVFALPTQELLTYMRSLFQGAPIMINFDSFGVELGSSRTPEEAFPENVYRALPGLMDVWYDNAEARSYWILPLVPSPEMVERHDQIGDAWSRRFVPFIRIAEVQNLERRRVAWMKSIASGLVSQRPILTFTNELVVDDHSIMPAGNDFYEDYVRRGLDTQVFTEIN